MKINEEHWQELRQCSLYKNLLPRYQKIIEWIFKEYTEMSEEENKEILVYFVNPQKNGSIKLQPSELKTAAISRRKLLNLDVLDFNFGLQFTSNKFMPFFGSCETGLFSSSRPVDEIENGDICLVKLKDTNENYLATKEEVGFFELDTSYLGSFEDIELMGVLINIRTK